MIQQLEKTTNGAKKSKRNEVSIISGQFNSVAQLCPTLLPHGLWHARPPYPLPAPWAYSNSCPLSRWCHQTIPFSVIPFSSCLRSFPASGSFLMSQVAWLRIRWPKYWSFSFSISPSDEYSGLISFIMTDCISLKSKGLSRVFSNTTLRKHPVFGTQLSL